MPQPPGNPPADLSAVDFAAAAKVIFGDTPPEKLIHTTLRVRHGYEAGQASMAIANPHSVDYGTNVAFVDQSKYYGGGLRIELNAKANQSYMFDVNFSVFGYEGCQFTVTGPDNAKQTISCPATNHLIAGFYSTTSGPQSFLFESQEWFLYSVAISAQSSGPAPGPNQPLPPANANAPAASSKLNPGDIKIFSSGNFRPGAAHAPPQPPAGSSAELSPAAFAAAAAAVFGNNVPPATLKQVVLTARHGYASGPANLVVTGPRSLDYAGDIISFDRKNYGTEPVAFIEFAAVAKQTYMVDMVYEVPNPSDAAKCIFTLKTDETDQDMSCTKAGLQHLIVGLYATATGTSQLQFEANVPWTFHNATITRQ